MIDRKDRVLERLNRISDLPEPGAIISLRPAIREVEAGTSSSPTFSWVGWISSEMVTVDGAGLGNGAWSGKELCQEWQTPKVGGPGSGFGLIGIVSGMADAEGAGSCIGALVRSGIFGGLASTFSRPSGTT